MEGPTAGTEQGAMVALRSAEGRRIDILRVDMANDGAKYSEIRHSRLLISALSPWSGTRRMAVDGGRDWSMSRLKAAGYTVHITAERRDVLCGLRPPFGLSRTDSPKTAHLALT